MTAYYNENEPFVAAWLQQLIAAGHIAPGVVDTRSIEDVTPDDLKGFTQCHFFAGIGVWSYALRKAGFSDDREIWTGSCPCQPFSAAGKGNGFADERHLWPAFFHLIEQCKPAVILGEQVASKDGLAWLDLVHADMEATDYAFGAADLCAAGFGAPHIRQRTFWVAHADGQDSRTRLCDYESGRIRRNNASRGGGANRLAHPLSGRCARIGRGSDTEEQRTSQLLETSRMADRQGSGRREERSDDGRGVTGDCEEGQPAGFIDGGSDLRAGPTNGHWRNVDWLGCRDGKWRPVEPGTFPLAHGAANRVGRLRGYGNAIVAPVAQGFIEAVMERLS